MRVAMHQPHYLPWLGLVDKVDRCDLFVVVDHVQFERKGWQNRNYVGALGGPMMLTVPVVQHSRAELIADKLVDNRKRWGLKHLRTLADNCYGRTPFWRVYRAEFEAIYTAEWERLAELSLATTRMVLDAFGIDTPMVRSSELGPLTGKKTDMIAEIALRVGADTVLSGDGARGYLVPEALTDRGIALEWQDFQHPVYRQHGRHGDFLPRLAAIDLLVNHGPEGVEVLRQARSHPVRT
ncbi:WbqC family protein [Allonocardiopsis opalescens]|uniref:WbqC-like protein n=1 Tax=Allonocardiopsis opalescens TaxID=1144618 RepID=A0A2T0Q6H7_9ACTN|nr:WbqC family protein [Allonocardiopsis opalescens]PRX99418.1 WbqC-like protein [Allonocardiopsis opalescens]